MSKSRVVWVVEWQDSEGDWSPDWDRLPYRTKREAEDVVHQQRRIALRVRWRVARYSRKVRP